MDDKSVQLITKIPGIKHLEIREGGPVTDVSFANIQCSQLETLILLRGKVTDAGISLFSNFNIK